MLNNTAPNQASANNSSCDLTLTHETGKMSSLEIAEITGKTHSNVMRDIRNLVEKLGETHGFKFELTFKIRQLPNGGSRKDSYYELGKKECLLLASGYDVALRAKIINRWEELETGKAEPIAKPRIRHPHDNKEIEASYLRAQATLIRAKEAKSKLLLKLAENESGTFSRICKTLAVNTLCGEGTLPLPEAGERTFSAEEIAKRLGTNRNVIGMLSSKNNLKTPAYGKWFHDKSPYCNKEVETFRYFESAIKKFSELLDGAKG